MLPWLMALALSVLVTACVLAAWAGDQRVDLVHLAYFDACAVHVHKIHWQNSNVPASMWYGYGVSSRSFVTFEVWIARGPVLSYTRSLPTRCQSSSTGAGANGVD